MTWVINPFNWDPSGCFFKRGLRLWHQAILWYNPVIYRECTKKMLFPWAGKGILLFSISKRNLRASYIYPEWRAISSKGILHNFIAASFPSVPPGRGDFVWGLPIVFTATLAVQPQHGKKGKQAFTGDSNSITYKVFFHQDIFSSPPCSGHFFHPQDIFDCLRQNSF